MPLWLPISLFINECLHPWLNLHRQAYLRVEFPVLPFESQICFLHTIWLALAHAALDHKTQDMLRLQCNGALAVLNFIGLQYSKFVAITNSCWPPVQQLTYFCCTSFDVFHTFAFVHVWHNTHRKTCNSTTYSQVLTYPSKHTEMFRKYKAAHEKTAHIPSSSTAY